MIPTRWTMLNLSETSIIFKLPLIFMKTAMNIGLSRVYNDETVGEEYQGGSIYEWDNSFIYGLGFEGIRDST